MSDIDLAAELAALDEAIASGVTEVTYAGRHVKYDDLQSLLVRRRWIIAQQSGGSAQQPQCAFATFDRGDC